MSADPGGGDAEPELATNDEWRRIMLQARKDQGLSQGELGAKLERFGSAGKTSQNMISEIESGKVRSSSFVMPICRALGIPPPQHFDSEDQATWSRLGHVLRAKNMRRFKAAMELVQSMVAEEEDEKPTAEPPANRK